MAKINVSRGLVGKILYLFIQDTTKSNGGGLTGLTFNSPGLVAAYHREGDVAGTPITLSAGTPGTWSSGGFVATDPANLPGQYELGLPNAALASGQSTRVYVQGASNMTVSASEIEVDTINLQDGVRLGLTALPNVASGGRGSLPVTVDAGGGVLVGGYEAGLDPATQVLQFPAFKLTTNLSGYVIASNIPNTTTTVPFNLGALPTPASNSPTNVPISIIRNSGVTMQIALSMAGFPLNLNIGDIQILFRVLPSTMTGTTLEPVPPPPLLQKDNLTIGGITILDAVNGLVALAIVPTDVSDGGKFPEGATQPYDVWVYAPSAGLASPAIVGTFTVSSL